MSCRAVAVLVVLVCPAIGAADPQLTGLVMPGAKVMAGFNIEQIKNTPFGRYGLARMQADEPSLRAFAGETGFDWRRDLHEVLIASTGQPGAGRTPALVLVRGNFDPARIAAALEKQNGRAEVQDGVTILRAGPKDAALAFLGPTVAVAGQVDDVRAAIARRRAPAPLDPAMAEQVERLSTAQDAWVLSLVPPSTAGAGIPDPAVQGALGGELLKSIERTSAGVKFGDTVNFTAEAVAASDQDAAALAGAVKMLAGMAQSGAGPVPAAALLSGLTVTSAERTVRLSLTIPEEEVEKLLKWPFYGLSGTKAMASEFMQ